jgi:hypothetical protein
MKLWRELKFFDHNLNHNQGTYSGDSCVQPNCDIPQDFIKRGHQEGVADGHQLKQMKNYAKKQSSARKTSQLTNHPHVLAKKEEVAQKAKRKFVSS